MGTALHLDEAAPRQRFIIPPLGDNAKLNHRKFFSDSRQVMADLRTEYAQAETHLGINQGRVGSMTQHQDVAKILRRHPNL